MNDSQLKQTSMRDFQILCKLGEGSFSQVFKVKRLSDGQEYALKKVKMGQLKDKEKENALNEVRILASLTDQFIVGYKECFIEESTSTLCIVMEFANGGDLQKKINDHIKNKTYFPEYEVWKSFIHMTRGLKVLHDMKILHRDLKCANIFMTKGGVYKLGDLNVSKVAKNKLVYTQTGTPYYASPEVWRDEPYDNKSDIWSLGCVVYEMCGLKPPFRANDMEGLFRKVQKGIFDRIPNRYSKELQQMIAACLQVNPSNRPDCDQLLENPIVIRNQPADSSSRPQSAKVKQNFSLLQTIKLPKNLSQLKGKLPKANYDQLAIDDDTQEDFNPFKGNNIRVAPQSAQPSKRTNPFGFNNNTNSSPEQQQQALLQQQLIQQQQLQQLQQQQQVIAKKYPQRPNPHATNKIEAPKQIQQVLPSSQLPDIESESLDLMPSLNPILKGELMNQSQQQQQQNKKSLISLVKENDIPMYNKPPEIDVKPNYSSNNNNNNNNNGNYGQQYGSNIRTPVVQEKTPSNLKQVNGRPSVANRRPQSGIQNVGSPLYKQQQQENSQEKIMPNNSGILRDRRNQIKQAPSQSRLQQQQNTPTSMLPNPKNRPISAQYDYMLGNNNNNNYSNPNQNVGGRIAPPEMPQMKNLRQLEKVNSQNLISREVLLMQEKLAQKQKALFSQQQQQQQQYQQQQQQQLQQQIPQSAMQPQRNQNNSRVAIVNGYQMPELHNNNNNKGAMGRNNQRIQSAKALLQGLPSKDLMPQQIYNREQFLSPQNNNNANSRLAQQQNMRPGLVNPYSYASNNNNNNNAQGLNGLGYVNNYGYGSNNNNNNNAYIQPKNQLPVSPVREITNSGLYSNNGYGYGSRQSRQQRPVVNSPVQRPTWWG